MVSAADSRGRQLISLHFAETEQLATMAFGAGVEEIDVGSEGITSHGGTVVWTKRRDTVGRNGHRHVFYRQRYRPPGREEAVPLFATSLGLHFGPDETLWFAYGHQYVDVVAVSRLEVATAIEALLAAQAAAASWPGFDPADHGQWPPEVMERLLSASRLVLDGEPDGTTFRFRWKVHVYDARGERFVLLLDAETGTLLSVDSTGRWSGEDCNPYDPVFTTARAQPQNAVDGPLDPETYFDVGASDSGGSIPSPYEAVWVDGNTGIRYEAYVGAGSDYCQDVVTGTAALYRRIGVNIRDNKPWYECTPGRGIMQHQCPDYMHFAGDALFFSRETMRAFSELFERCGYDGACSPVRVVVDANYGCIDGAAFKPVADGPSWVPSGGVAVCKRHDNATYSASAALDVIAHEWGHGIEWAADGLFEEGSLSEGFADVIGHTVEWFVHGEPQPSFGWHSGDWQLGEDWAGDGYARVCLLPEETRACEGRRRADAYDERNFVFDNEICNWFSWYPGTTVPRGRWSLHADDQECPNDEIHAIGNQLAVALMLMTDGGPNGGFNPICAANKGHGNGNVCGPGRDQQCSGCDLQVLDPFHVPGDPHMWKKGPEILYKVLVDLSDHQADSWEDIAHQVKMAAFGLFASPYYPDPDCALDEQRTVARAFNAIGRPDPDPGYIWGPVGCIPEW